MQRNRFYFASENRLKLFENSAWATVQTPRDQYGGIAVGTVAVDAAQPDIIYIGGAKNIYASSATVCRSTAAGATWVNLTTGSGPHEVAWIRVHPVTREVWLVGGGVKVVEKRRFENPVVVSLERNSFGEV